MGFLKQCALYTLFVFSLQPFLIAQDFTIRVANAGYESSFSARQRLNTQYPSSALLSIMKKELADVLNNKPEKITLSFPTGHSLPSVVSLKQFSVFASDARTVLMTERGEQNIDFRKQWVSYIGLVEGNSRSLVVATFSRFGMEMLIDLGTSRYSIKAMEVGTSAEAAQSYVLINDNAGNSEQIRCGIDDSKNTGSKSEALRSYPGSPNVSAAQNLVESYLSKQSTIGESMTARSSVLPAISTDTIDVRIALDADQSLYLAKGSSFDSTTVLMLNAFSQVSAVYLRDLSVSLKVAFSRVWSTPPPFAANDIFSSLKQFQTYWILNPGGIERTTTHLFSLKFPGSPGVGGYAYLNSLCDPKYGYGVTAVDTNSNGHILTFAHELGHNFGSYHTHSCLWPNGPIDHCSDIEGGCSSGPNVDTVGTIMSYCSTREMKFHPTTIALMRRVVETSWCALSASSVAVAQSDSAFLDALYTSTAGSGWINKTNWNSASVKGRYGVAVRSGRVVSIDLAANNLTGPLPNGLTDLTALRRLNLSGRNFHHEPSVSQRDPSEFINNQNAVSGQIPVGIDQLSALEFLDLSNNIFTGTIPSSIGNLTQLRWLNLSENPNLSGTIPPSVGNLKNLELLDLYRTYTITGGIPNEVTMLPQLRVLIISDNSQLGGTIPLQIGSLSKLTFLNLSSNTMTGSIPASITSIATLEQLQLQNNQLSGSIPSDIGNFKNLNTLALNDNKLTGTIPASFSSLTKIGSLNLSRNTLSGSIPASIGDMNLLGLYLSDNAFSGTIPIALGKLSSLLELDMSRNALTGTIPDTLRNLGSTAPGDFGGLLMFNIGDNQLTGTVPSWLAQKTHLSQLDLGGNNFSPVGAFPQWILDLPSPVLLKLSNLGITGTIPLALTTKLSLSQLDLSNNQLTGSIPSELGNLASLRMLRLSNNQLTGPIPIQLSSINFLLDFRVDNNLLTDTIPGFFIKYPSLQYLHLQNNKFTAVPKNLVNSGSIREFLLSNNDLESLPNIPNSSVVHTDSTSRVEVENNKVMFADLLPYVNGNLKGLKYAPQKPFASTKMLSISQASRVTLAVDIDGNGNEFQWLKNGVPVFGTTSSEFWITSLSTADTGQFVAKVTNPAVPLLTLERNPFIVKISNSSLPGDLTLVSPRSKTQNVAKPVQLSWNHDPKASKYHIEIDSAGTFSSMLYVKDTSLSMGPIVTLTLPLLKKVSTYYWRVQASNGFGVGNWSPVWSFTAPGGTNSIIKNESSIPTEYKLHQNYPNPFNPTTVIRYQVPVRGFVMLKIFDMLGREVTTLVNEERSPGYYEMIFDGKNLSSGIYFYRMESEKFSATKRLMLLK